MKRSETGKGLENVGGHEGEFFYTVQNAKNRIPQVWRIPQFKIKITEIPQEKLSNTAIPQTPMPPLLIGAQCQSIPVYSVYSLQIK